MMGTATCDAVHDIAGKVWDLFHLLICNIRVIEDDRMILSPITSCSILEIGSRELKLLRKANEWQI